MKNTKDTPVSYLLEIALDELDYPEVRELATVHVPRVERRSIQYVKAKAAYTSLANGELKDFFDGLLEETPSLATVIQELGKKVLELQGVIRLMQEAGHPFFDDLGQEPEVQENVDPDIPF